MAVGERAAEYLEAPEEELDESEAALLHIGRYMEARRALPWAQWSFREKASYYMDRMFLGFLILFFLVMFGEIVYKIWYISNVKKMTALVKGAVAWLFGWLFPKEGKEELRGL